MKFLKTEEIRHWAAGKYLDELRNAVEPSEFGYRIQGLAGHVLLRLGFQILQINAAGHPDILARNQQGLVRLEIEADMFGCRARELTLADLLAIAPQGVLEKGYFAVALCGPYPRWAIVDSTVLHRRFGNPASPAILQALRDVKMSDAWTTEFINLLASQGEHLLTFSYEFLVQRALADRPV